MNRPTLLICMGCCMILFIAMLQNPNDGISTPDIPKWMGIYQSTPLPEPPEPSGICQPASYTFISKVVASLDLDANRYAPLTLDLGDRSYWAEQEAPEEHIRLIMSVRKTILDKALDQVASDPHLKSITDRIPNKGFLEILTQRWLADRTFSDAYARMRAPCMCPNKNQEQGSLVCSLRLKQTELYINEGDVNYALGLARQNRLDHWDLSDEHKLFDAAKELELRCDMPTNLHLYYYRGNGVNLLRDYPTPCRLALLIGWKAALLAAERQRVTIRDVGELTYVADQIVQHDPAIQAYCGCH